MYIIYYITLYILTCVNYSLITIDGKSLPGISDKDSIFQRIESYREYLDN